MSTQDDATTTADDAEDTGEPTAQHCRHCGRKTEVNVEANPDWQCPHCGHFQKTVACPVCGQPVSTDVLPADQVPEPAKPRNR